jgi:hypothetical protein
MQCPYFSLEATKNQTYCKRQHRLNRGVLDKFLVVILQLISNGVNYSARLFSESSNTMSLEFKPGTAIKLTISKAITRAAAEKTVTRLFMKDKAFAAPIAIRSANFKAQPKRRGGRIWTKWPNKIHPTFPLGATATIRSTPQFLKDLASVQEFVTVAAA